MRTGSPASCAWTTVVEIEFVRAYGLADRAHHIPNTVDTRFAIASGTKGLTALTVVSLIEDDALRLSTTARSVLGNDLPLIGDDVTIEHLLAHRSGIGDYLDEEAGHDDHRLRADGTGPRAGDHRAVPGRCSTDTRPSSPGRAVLLLQQRLRRARADRRAGQRRALPRSRAANASARPPACATPSSSGPTSCPDRTAIGYLTIDGGSRTNVFHLPVRGNGDGGIYSTVADISGSGSPCSPARSCPTDWVAEMVRPRSDVPSESMRYGLGFWLHRSSDTVMLEGYDAGVSFRSVHDPRSTSRTP